MKAAAADSLPMLWYESGEGPRITSQNTITFIIVYISFNWNCRGYFNFIHDQNGLYWKARNILTHKGKLSLFMSWRIRKNRGIFQHRKGRIFIISISFLIYILICIYLIYEFYLINGAICRIHTHISFFNMLEWLIRFTSCSTIYVNFI